MLCASTRSTSCPARGWSSSARGRAGQARQGMSTLAGVCSAPARRGRLFRQLRGQAVDVHLEVFVLAVGSDDRFDELAHRTDGLALPDADPESMILGGRVNG